MLVNGVPATRPAQRVLLGDVVQVDVAPPPARQSPSAEPLPLSIIYEDAQLLVVVKPAGMVAHPSHRHRSGTLVNALLWHATKVRGDDWQPRLVQRLDKDTSGLLLVAKSGAVQTALQGDRVRFVKEYLAVVWGRPAAGARRHHPSARTRPARSAARGGPRQRRRRRDALPGARSHRAARRAASAW